MKLRTQNVCKLNLTSELATEKLLGFELEGQMVSATKAATINAFSTALFTYLLIL